MLVIYEIDKQSQKKKIKIWDKTSSRFDRDSNSKRNWNLVHFGTHFGLAERNRKRYSTAVSCFQIVRIFYSKVQTEKISSDFLTLWVISYQKGDHHVNQSFLEYFLNILSIENCGICLKEVCDFLDLNSSYFRLFFKNLIQWN